MNRSIQSLLAADHASLDQLLSNLDGELASENPDHAFKLLDRFWVRLAVHIRGENLVLFPALVNAPSKLFHGRRNLPTQIKAHELIVRLRSDHDFFMKELGWAVKMMRSAAVGERVGGVDAGVHPRMAVLGRRLQSHNLLEEEQVYKWPALLFDEAAIAQLVTDLRRELENLPPRLRD